MTLSDPWLTWNLTPDCECGQTITVFTYDQQLYRNAGNNMGVYLELFLNVQPWLGGMYTLVVLGL